MDILSCNWDTAKYLIFSTNVYEPLVYYSHFITLFAALLLGFVVLKKDFKDIKNILFFAFTFSIATWVYFNLILWASEKDNLIMYFWSMINVVEFLMFIFAFYLTKVFLGEKKGYLSSIILFTVLLIPFLFLNHTISHLIAYDLSNCFREVFDGPLVTYLYFTEGFILLYFIYKLFKIINKNRNSEWGMNVFFVANMTFFLGIFVLDNMLVLFRWGYEFEQYKLFGTVIFLSLFMLMVIRYSLFKVKLFATQALVWILIILFTSQYLSSTTDAYRILNVVTLICMLLFGVVLVNSIKRLESQKEQLEISNNEQGVLLHFITHQVKGFFTKTRGIFAMINEGDYGPVPEYLNRPIQEGLKADENGINTVMSVLNASNIKEGKIASFDEKFDIIKSISELIKNYKSVAEEKGLIYEYKIPETGFDYFADKFQITNVFKNLLENAINYTEKGKVEVELRVEGDSIFFRIKDTGIGITEEDMRKLFLPGGRGKDSVVYNVNSTGYGLFIVKKILDHYKGHIFVDSQGFGKGSEFTVLLPIND